VQFSLYSDKEPSFLSALFAHVNAMLGICHVTSAARTARSNGEAEALVKHLSEHLKFYAKDDYTRRCHSNYRGQFTSDTALEIINFAV